MFNKDASRRKFGRPPKAKSMPKIHLFNDNGCRHLYPFHLVEGVEGIRHGAFTQEERWRQVEEDLVQRGWQGDVSVNSRWIPDAHTADDLLTAGSGSLAFNGLRLSQPLSQSADPITAVELEREPRMIAHANDLFSHLGEQLLLDVDALAALWNLSPFSAAPPTHTFGAADQIMVAEDAVVRAATLDASSGPILIGPGVTLEPGSHIEGPALIHRHAVVRAGAHVRGATVIGPHSKVGGELSNVNFQGWANKAHGGFLGNSVIGRWCNLGAGTVSSNLKNTYGSVRQWSDATGQMEDTGLQFCGVLMGDHTKCGIGTTLNTGTVLGPACVVFDVGFPPKHLPPFSWHDAKSGRTELHDLPRMLATANTVMARRNEALSDAAKDNLSALFSRNAGNAPLD
jgi:UDP-N-acetylglucosamine diphosphorylase/glucosamine-1-phosphate N-acetyltransferase